MGQDVSARCCALTALLIASLIGDTVTGTRIGGDSGGSGRDRGSGLTTSLGTMVLSGK